jgi:dihydroorotase
VTSVVLANARLVDPASARDERGAVLVRDGVIADIAWGGAPDAPEGAEVIDCGGHVLAPGLVDMRAFIGEPGAEHRETLKSASEAAAAGGVTTIVCMPDTNPVIDDPAIVDFVLRRARDTAIVNIRPAAALTKGLHGREMTEIGLLREAGAIAFTDGARSVGNAQVMRRALTYARDFGALLMHHVEDADLVGEGVMNEGEFASRLGLPGIPREAETLMLERDIRLVRLTGARYHAAMISCADSVDIVARAKDMGLPVTCGVSINSLTLNENDIGDYRTFLKLSPPLRGEDDRQALIGALADGVIDAVVSDHNPQDVETKRLPFAEAADGAVGIETLLSAALRLVHGGQIPLPKLLRALAAQPANILGLPGGRLAPGAPADLILVDIDAPYVLDKRDLRSRSKNSPFDEARLQGQVLKTLVGGSIVFERSSDYIPRSVIPGEPQAREGDPAAQAFPGSPSPPRSLSSGRPKAGPDGSGRG